jgi:hypothetical protein
MSTPGVGMSGLRCVMALRARGNGINKRGNCVNPSSGGQALCRSLLSRIRPTSELYMKNDVG